MVCGFCCCEPALILDSLEVETGHNLAVDVLFLLLLARDKHSLLFVVFAVMIMYGCRCICVCNTVSCCLKSSPRNTTGLLADPVEYPQWLRLLAARMVTI